MRFVATEDILGAVFCYLANSDITKVSEEQIMKFNFNFINIASVDERTICNIRQEEIVKFADENRDLISFRFDLSEINIKVSKERILKRFEEKYFNKIKLQIEDFDNLIDKAWIKVLS